VKPRFFRAAAELRRWLATNHAEATELWLGAPPAPLGAYWQRPRTQRWLAAHFRPQAPQLSRSVSGLTQVLFPHESGSPSASAHGAHFTG
jgi:hypothetical protein